jgi:hypothetical protein
MAKKKPAIEYPKCLAILLCDLFVTDPNSSKPNIFGVFDVFTPAKLPGTASFCVYGKFYGGNGKIPISVELLDPVGKPVEGASLDIESMEFRPKRVSQVGGVFAKVPLKKKGMHKLVFRSGKHIIAESNQIEVRLRAKNGT